MASLHSYLVSVLLLLSVAIPAAIGIKCWTCENADSIEECNELGRMEHCNGAQNTCGIEVRGNDVWRLTGVKIYKFCKEDVACQNLQNQNMQNAWNLTQCNPKFPNSVCRCCCHTDNCNVGELACLNTEDEMKNDVEEKDILGSPPTSCFPAHSAPKNGRVTCSSSSEIGSVCSFSCDRGYYLSGRPTTTCETSGEWSDIAPTCQPIVCPALAKIDNGSFKCDRNALFGSVCSFNCDFAYYLVGSDISICQQDDSDNHIGAWSTSGQSCQRRECSRPLHAPTNGDIRCTEGKLFGSICEFSCGDYYKLVGAVISTCAENDVGLLRWTNRVPKCQRKKCNALPQVPDNGDMLCSDGSFYGSFCAFECDLGHRRIGEPYTMCGTEMKKSTGSTEPDWDRDSPVCERKSCEELSAVDNGYIACTDGNFFGSECEYVCDDSYRLVGTSHTNCTEDRSGNMEWSEHVAPVCERITCPALKDIKFGQMECTDGDFVNSECKFQCTEKDYNLYPKHQEAVTCQNNSTWSERPPCCARSCPPYAVMDLIVILDSSSSIGAPSWQIMLEFVNSIFDRFIVQHDAMNFGVVRYNRIIDTETRINLNECPDSIEMLKKLVSEIPYDGDGTWTGQAITYVHEHMLMEEYGNRPGVPDVVLVITDGRSQDDVMGPAQAMRDDGVLTFVCGITPTDGRLDLAQLQDIAGSEDRLFLAKDGFNTLTPEFAAEISENICGNPCDRVPY